MYKWAGQIGYAKTAAIASDNAAAMVKGRNEPVAIARVAYAVAKIKGVELEVVTEAYVLRKSVDRTNADCARIHGSQ